MTKEKQEAIKQAFEERPIATRKRVRLSKDGQWMMVDIIKTVILHRNYVEAILSKGGSDDKRNA